MSPAPKCSCHGAGTCIACLVWLLVADRYGSGGLIYIRGLAEQDSSEKEETINIAMEGALKNCLGWADGIREQSDDKASRKVAGWIVDHCRSVLASVHPEVISNAELYTEKGAFLTNAAPQGVEGHLSPNVGDYGHTGSGPAVAVSSDKDYRISTDAENLMVLRARLSEHLSPAETRELERAADTLDLWDAERSSAYESVGLLMKALGHGGGHGAMTIEVIERMQKAEQVLSAILPIDPTEDMIRAGVNAWIQMYPRSPLDFAAARTLLRQARTDLMLALALLRELNDALVIPGWLQPRVDAILDHSEQFAAEHTVSKEK